MYVIYLNMINLNKKSPPPQMKNKNEFLTKKKKLASIKTYYFNI